MSKHVLILNFFRIYNILWAAALPFLKKNKRLADGFVKRISTGHLAPADIWIQAASAGESYLAVQVLKTLAPDIRVRILVTTLTSQGRDILSKHLGKNSISPNIHLAIEWFPFDKPDIMKKAVTAVRPKVMVLLETEIWPALLFYLKQSNCRVAIVNARLSNRSFPWYKRTRLLWKHLAPDLICAISESDADRYQQLFNTSRIETMSNIKFETMDTSAIAGSINPTLDRVFSKGLPITILASVRRQEERQVLDIIRTLIKQQPNQVMALFPRHMHRIRHWKKHLAHLALPCRLRSEIKRPLSEPGIILWDTFGELQAAYAHASVVFVGGSLVPLGGQNFLEPAVTGVPTVIGPYYDDFAWVGENIFKQKIIIKEKSWDAVARTMTNILNTSSDRQVKFITAQAYIHSCRGGTKTASRLIERCLK